MLIADSQVHIWTSGTPVHVTVRFRTTRRTSFSRTWTIRNIQPYLKRIFDAFGA